VNGSVIKSWHSAPLQPAYAVPVYVNTNGAEVVAVIDPVGSEYRLLVRKQLGVFRYTDSVSDRTSTSLRNGSQKG